VKISYQRNLIPSLFKFFPKLFCSPFCSIFPINFHNQNINPINFNYFHNRNPHNFPIIENIWDPWPKCKMRGVFQKRHGCGKNKWVWPNRERGVSNEKEGVNNRLFFLNQKGWAYTKFFYFSANYFKMDQILFFFFFPNFPLFFNYLLKLFSIKNEIKLFFQFKW